MSTKWVAIDKKMATTFKEIHREYSKIEAMYSLSLDVNCGRERSLRAYSRMWTWSIGKVKRFIKTVKYDNYPETISNGTPTEHQRNTNGTPYSLILLQNQNTTEHQRNTNGTPTEHEYKEQRTKNKEKTLKKEIKKKTFSRPDWITKNQWSDLLENRKFKKLQNTHRALATFTASLKRGVEAGYPIEVCIGEFVASSWKRFNHEWIKNNSKSKRRYTTIDAFTGMIDGLNKNKTIDSTDGIEATGPLGLPLP